MLQVVEIGRAVTLRHAVEHTQVNLQRFFHGVEHTAHAGGGLQPGHHLCRAIRHQINIQFRPEVANGAGQDEP